MDGLIRLFTAIGQVQDQGILRVFRIGTILYVGPLDSEKSTVTFLLVTQGSPALSGTVHSSTCGPLPESNIMYTLLFPIVLSLSADRER